MVTQFFCPLLGVCVKARFAMLGRTAITCQVRSKFFIQTMPTVSASILVTCIGSSAVGALGNLSVLSAG